MIRTLTLVLSAVFLATCFGCSSRPVVHRRLTVSTKTAVAPPHDVLGPVSASYCDTVLLLVLPFVHDQRDAYDELLDHVRDIGGNAVVDFQVTLERTRYFFPLYVNACWNLRGTAIRFH